ncbi:hypothetical protein MKW98_016323 [Papaver atlanticum]|uniref:Uncharacterized protein n=1 Tax=Papaver atlanticum TaxID=357466 RepID=A0AAD4XEM3_9MAGN|nr:hypothetical protein MKW98_016323 [Papaver atlanticum]
MVYCHRKLMILMAVVASKKGFELHLRKASGGLRLKRLTEKRIDCFFFCFIQSVPKENGEESDEEIRRVPEMGSEEPGPSISGRGRGGGREPGPDRVQASTTVGSTQRKGGEVQLTKKTKGSKGC